MTTTWHPCGEWQGATVAILAGGPSMCAELAGSLRHHRCIAINAVHEIAPWADMLVALDGNWPQAYRNFAGLRVTGTADASLDAFYIGLRYETVELSPTHRIEVRNSGLEAMRIAAGMGAARIILAGMEPEKWSTSSRWASPPATAPNPADPYEGVAAGMAQVTRELQAGGIVVEHCNTVAARKPTKRR